MNPLVKAVVDATNNVVMVRKKVHRGEAFWEDFEAANQAMRDAQAACKAADIQPQPVAKARKNFVHHIVVTIEGKRLGTWIDFELAQKACDAWGARLEWLEEPKGTK